jgi:hypothetical protein
MIVQEARGTFGIGLALGLALSTGAAASANAASKYQLAWALADQLSSSDYTADPAFSYNSGGGAIRIFGGISDPGKYTVSLSRQPGRSKGNLQLFAINTSGYCVTPQWEGSLYIAVSCFDANGNHADTAFAMLYQERNFGLGNAGKGVAYLLADQPETGSYTANPDYSYNSSGGVNAVVRNSTGNYTTNLPGLTKRGGSVLVTAVGGRGNYDNPLRCKTSGWSANASGTQVNVLCFGPTGAATDAQFSLAYALFDPFAVEIPATAQGAYARADQPTQTNPYTPSPAFQFNSFSTGRLAARSTGTGQYSASIPGNLSYSSSIALATAVGSDSSYCNVTTWLPIGVACYGQGGNPIDSQFEAAFQTAQ